ncbi:hypothetical protein ACWD9K_36800 [Streptomyces sp. 900116325]
MTDKTSINLDAGIAHTVSEINRDALHQRLQSLEFPCPSRAGDKAARHAVVQADVVAAWLFPTTVYAVVHASLWHGYPPVRERGLEAPAVAFLGSADGTRGPPS